MRIGTRRDYDRHTGGVSGDPPHEICLGRDADHDIQAASGGRRTGAACGQHKKRCEQMPLRHGRSSSLFVHSLQVPEKCMEALET